MGPKKQAQPAKGGKQQSSKPKKEGGKAKKKKWSKGKMRDQLNNACLFDAPTLAKLEKDIPSSKLITPAIVSERIKIRASLAKHALKDLCAKGMIKKVVQHNKQMIYTRATAGKADE